MRRYTSFSALIGAFFSKDLYRDVAHSWSGIGFLHLLLLAFLGSVPFMASMHLKLNSFAEKEFPDIVKNFPEVQVHKGQVSSPIAQPYTVMDDSKPPKPLFVLDTTGKINNLDETTANILVTKTKLFSRQQKNQQRIQELSDCPDVEITPAKLRQWMKIFATWFAPVGTLGLMAWYVFIGLMGMMVLSLFGALVAGSQSTLSTGGYMRLASIARTPSFLLNCVVSLLNLNIPMWFFAQIGVSFGYMMYAVTAANEIPKKPFDAAAPPPPEPIVQSNGFSAPPEPPQA